MLSLNKLLGKGRSSYIVSCELPDGNDHHEVKARNFDCSGVDGDLGAHVNAVRFAKAAETVPEFRAFLFGAPDGLEKDQRFRVRSYVCMREKYLTGVRYAVAMCRLESGQLRSISFFGGTAADEVTDAKGEKQVLGKAEQFLRSVAFDSWRREVSRESPVKIREQAAGSQLSLGKERGLKHPHSFVEIDGGEKVDCKCGKNRSHGLMMACERCGAWEHAECQGFRSNKQIPADYICSACVRAEREEVVVIRCEEQEKLWSTSLEDTLAGTTFREHEDCTSVCCLCGCEDNEYFESLVQPCGCVGCSLLAHSSCITMMKVGASDRDQHLQRSGLCCFCGSSIMDSVGNETKLQKGGQWVEEVPDSENTKLVKGDQLGVARKRLRSTGCGGSALPGKLEHGEKLSGMSDRNDKVLNTVNLEKVLPDASPTDSKKGSSPFLGRRFSDAAANVPIKKRRIQLEMARSPSPPTGNLKLQPEIPAVHEVLVATKPSDSQSSEEVNVTDADSDGNGSGIEKSSTDAQVQIIDSKAPVAALNVSEASGIAATAPGADTEGGFVVSQSTLQLVGCKSEKGDGESQQRKGNGSVTENGTPNVNNRSEEEGSLVSQIDVQQQQRPPIHALSPIPSREEVQACAVESGIQSEDMLSDTSVEDRAALSPNSKRKFSETDMGAPARDYLGEEEFSRSRPSSRAGNMSFQTSVAGSTGEVYVRGLVQEGSAMTKASTLAGDNNGLRDDRLHWDLNMDMEEWERPSAEDHAVAMAQNLSLLTSSGAEKRKGSAAKEFVQESHKCESGATVGSSSSFEDGRLKQNFPPQESADTLRESSAARTRDGPLKSEVLVEGKEDMNLTLSRMTEDKRRSTSSPGAIVTTHTANRHEYPEEKPETFCNSLQGDKSTLILQEDNQSRKLETAPAPAPAPAPALALAPALAPAPALALAPALAPAPDQEAEVRHIGESLRAVSPIVNKEIESKVFLGTDEGKKDFDYSCSEIAEARAETFFVNVEEDTCGTQSVKVPADSSEAADIVHLEKQSECHSENLSQKGHSEVLTTATIEVPSAVSVTKTNSISNVTEPGRCDEEEGALREDEKLVHKEVVEEFVNDSNQLSISPSRQPATAKWEGSNGEDPEAEDVDYGDSDTREGDDLEVEDKLQRGAVAEVESTWNPYDETKVSEVEDVSTSQAASASQDASASPSQEYDADGLINVVSPSDLTRKRRHQSDSSDSGEFQGMDVEEAHAEQMEDPNLGSSSGKGSPNSEINGNLLVEEDKVGDEHVNGSASIATSDSRRTSLERTEDMSGNARSGKAVRKSEVWRESPESGGSRVRMKSGWDQLPDGFQSAEEALQAAKSNAGPTTAWGPSHHYVPPFSGWSGSSNMHFSSGDSRYLPGHGRGMLPGPAAAAERGQFEKPAWSRGDHPRRNRMDAGLEIRGRVPVNQDLRQSGGSRPRPGPPPLEPGHRHQRRQGGWPDEAGAPPLWTYGPGRHVSPPGSSREPYGFHPPHKTRNAAAVAAAKVESSGLVVAPDGTVIKAGAGAPAPLRGMGGKGRGGGFGDMAANGVMTGVGNTHPLRIGGDVDLRGRELLNGDTRGLGGTDAPPHFKRAGERFGPGPGPFPPGSSMPRGPPGMLGNPSRYRWTRDERSFVPPVEQVDRPLFSKRTNSFPRSRLSPPPPRFTNEPIPDDVAQPRKSRTVDSKVEVEPEVTPMEPDSSAAPPPPKLPLPPPPPRAQRSPPAGLKRLNSKREADWPRGRERSRDREREWDNNRDRDRASSRSHYSPSRRSSPHVIHGSALTDERDRLLLAGIDRSRDPAGSVDDVVPPRSVEDAHDARRPRHYDGHPAKGEDLGFKSRAQSSRGGDNVVKDFRSEGDKGSRVANDLRSDFRRDFQKSGGVHNVYKHSSSREGEDDVAPRRRRPS